jgi:hypothetical protein
MTTTISSTWRSMPLRRFRTGAKLSDTLNPHGWSMSDLMIACSTQGGRLTIIASRLSDTGRSNRDTKIVRAPIVEGSQVRVERLLRRHRMSGFWKFDGPLRVESRQ